MRILSKSVISLSNILCAVRIRIIGPPVLSGSEGVRGLSPRSVSCTGKRRVSEI
jgi:hypothetical protein